VPEKAEAFLREALCAASDELPPCVAMMRWFAAPDQRKASLFQTRHAAGLGDKRGVSCFLYFDFEVRLESDFTVPCSQEPIAIDLPSGENSTQEGKGMS
jgi:hypothetical protein